MPSNSDTPVSFENWLNVLDAMSESVAQTLEGVTNREPDAANVVAEGALPRDAELRRRLDSTIQGLQQRLATARTLAARIEDMLDRDEQEVRAWRATAMSARQRLAASPPLS